MDIRSDIVSGSFGMERRETMRRHCRVLFLTGMALTIGMVVMARLLPGFDPQLVGGLESWRWAFSGIVSATSFAAGLLAVHMATGPRQLNSIAFGVIALNLLVIAFREVAYGPMEFSYVGISVLLFLAAAFIPWPAVFQAGLGVLAVVWFLLAQWAAYLFFPDGQAYWTDRGGLVAFRNNLVWGVAVIGFLGTSSVLMARSLYRLAKTAHQAIRLGSYEIIREVGSGGMGQVFEARHAFLLRSNALKVLRLKEVPWEDRQTLTARFEREIRLSSTLSHPNAITIYDVGRTRNNDLYYAMEYLEGLDLRRLVERFGPLPPARAVHILRQICGPLEEAHSHGIIHRDVKPANIFVTTRGGLYDYVKVLDFGIAKETESADVTELTRPGAAMGTPHYMAPEMALGVPDIDERADIYQLGCVAYWMLTGRPPFESDSAFALLQHHIGTPPVLPSLVAPQQIPLQLETVVMRCLEKDLGRRYQTVQDVAAALVDIRSEQPWGWRQAREWWELQADVDFRTVPEVNEPNRAPTSRFIEVLAGRQHQTEPTVGRGVSGWF